MAFEKLADKHLPFIRLILRSPDIGDGWRNVSEPLRPAIIKGMDEMPDLYERDETDGLKVRLSEEGRIIAKYA